MMLPCRDRVAGAEWAQLVLDEFTSELNRPVALMMAMALRTRLAARYDSGWVLAACNADVVPYLIFRRRLSSGRHGVDGGWRQPRCNSRAHFAIFP